MKILFIDDEPYRHELVDSYLAEDHNIIHVYNAEEAIEHFKLNPSIDLAMFDHDLGNYIDGGDTSVLHRNGSALASDILNILLEEEFPKKVIVHSMNFNGASNIYSKFYSAKVPVEIRMFSNDMLMELVEELKGK
jgi:DNA-binding NarL/FixJ family response regulator